VASVYLCSLIVDDPLYPQLHVVEHVGVEEPVFLLVGLERDHCCLHRSHVDRVLQGRVRPLPVENAEEVPVAVHGVVHHRPIGNFEANALSFLNATGVRGA